MPRVQCHPLHACRWTPWGALTPTPRACRARGSKASRWEGPRATHTAPAAGPTADGACPGRFWKLRHAFSTRVGGRAAPPRPHPPTQPGGPCGAPCRRRPVRPPTTKARALKLSCAISRVSDPPQAAALVPLLLAVGAGACGPADAAVRKRRQQVGTRKGALPGPGPPSSGGSTVRQRRLAPQRARPPPACARALLPSPAEARTSPSPNPADPAPADAPRSPADPSKGRG